MPLRILSRSRKRMFVTMVAASSAAALGLGAASPVMATNEVRVKVDPLNWNMAGTFSLSAPPFSNSGTKDSRGFSVQAGGGPQQVYNFEMGSPTSTGDFLDKNDDCKGHLGENEYCALTANITDATATASGLTKDVENAQVIVENYEFGTMDAEVDENFTPARTDVPLEYSLSKQEDPSTGKSFYELKFFAKNEAPASPPADMQLQNLAQVQSAGITPDDCTHSVALSPGDSLVTGDGNDTVCATIDNGDGSSSDPITVDTGDGNDTVLINGDTDANVQVDTGRGNDVVVSDTDADVDVTTGGGHDAVVTGGDTEVGDVTDTDEILEIQR